MSKPRVLDTYWRAQAERFWHQSFLEYLIEDLRFSPKTAAELVHMALQKRRVMAYGNASSEVDRTAVSSIAA